MPHPFFPEDFPVNQGFPLKASKVFYLRKAIHFKQIVASGALTRTSNGTYVEANGYTKGKVDFRLRLRLPAELTVRRLAGWDDCSDTPVSDFSNVETRL